MSFVKDEPSPPRRPAPRAPSPFRSLTFRLGAWYAGILLCALTLLGGVALFAVRRAVVHADELVVHERLERHTAVLGRMGLPGFEHAIDDATALEGEHGPVRVRDGVGRTLFKHGDVEGAAIVVSTSVSRDLHLEVASSAEPWARVAGPVQTAVLALVLGCLLFGIVGGVFLTRRALRPVGALATTVQAVIHSGDLSQRVDVSGGGGGSELDQLARLVNRMLERNQTLVRTMREALDNVAHDLRTPLTRLRGIAEVALRANDPAQSSEALADCIEESDRTLVMLRTLMDISEAEAGLMKLDLTVVDLRAIAAETVELYEPAADDGGVALSLVPGDEVVTLADRNRVRQALANLVDNAVKYTPRGGHVTVSAALARDDSEARLNVRDDGHGIPAEALDRIWERLYRVDPSRAERGLGLGLSLVKAIALAHGGRVGVDSTPGTGSTFLMALPLRVDERPGPRQAAEHDNGADL